MTATTHQLGIPASGSALPSPSLILIAEDEYLVAMGISSSVASMGFDVQGPATDGPQALSLARERRPDLAVLDIRMPGMSGIECARVLWRELSVPCVVLSAYSDHEHVVDAQEAGVFGYLLKPLGADALRVSLQTAWARAHDDVSHRRRIAELESSLASRKVIEQAKWKLIEVRGLTEPQAHLVLQKAARSDRRALIEVAQEVLDSASHPLLRAD